MLKDLLEILTGFLSSLFGDRTQPKPIPKPPIDKEDIELESTIQDAHEVPVESIETVDEAEILAESFEPVESPKDLPEIIETTTPVTTEPVISESEKTDSTSPADKQKEKEEREKPKPKPKSRFLWCLDNGHGKNQAGKRSPFFTLNGKKVQLLEYQFNRDIVERIMLALDEHGVSYFDVVPDYEDVASFLKGRVERANKKTSGLPKIYVSVHANAGPRSHGDWTSASGIETWYHSKNGAKIAAVFQKQLMLQLPNWKNRHLKSTSERGVYVLKHTNMPSILTENGFYNNRSEVKELMKDSVRQKIANAHVNAILHIEKHGYR